MWTADPERILTTITQGQQGLESVHQINLSVWCAGDYRQEATEVRLVPAVLTILRIRPLSF